MAVLAIAPNNGQHRIDTDLTLHELAVIGYVTVLWADLEHRLLLKTIELSEQAGNDELPEDASSLSFKSRLRAYRALVKSTVKDEKKRAELLSLAMSIGSIERARNRIAHGLWDWDFADPTRLRSSSFRVPFDFDEPFDFRKLLKLAKRIGGLSFRLAYPGGVDEALETQAQAVARRGSSWSRQFLLQMKGIDPETLHLAPPTPRVRRKPRSPSRGRS
jgi:hypothetical protein